MVPELIISLQAYFILSGWDGQLPLDHQLRRELAEDADRRTAFLRAVTLLAKEDFFTEDELTAVYRFAEGDLRNSFGTASPAAKERGELVCNILGQTLDRQLRPPDLRKVAQMRSFLKFLNKTEST